MTVQKLKGFLRQCIFCKSQLSVWKLYHVITVSSIIFCYIWILYILILHFIFYKYLDKEKFFNYFIFPLALLRHENIITFCFNIYLIFINQARVDIWNCNFFWLLFVRIFILLFWKGLIKKLLHHWIRGKFIIIDTINASYFWIKRITERRNLKDQHTVIPT